MKSSVGVTQETRRRLNLMKAQLDITQDELINKLLNFWDDEHE